MVNAEEAENYYIGFNAWDKWFEKLGALEEMDDKTRNGSMLGNSWIYECLTAYRAAAAEYLHAVAGEFEPEPAEHLKRAAGLYGKMSGEVLAGDTCLLDIAPLPWSLKEGQTWTSEMRQDQMRRLQEALPLEREAVEEIEKALALAEDAKGA